MDEDDKYIRRMMIISASLIIGFFLLICSTLLFCGCTLSVTTVHTQGTASDVVDEEQSTDPNVNPNISIPAL